MQGGKSTALLQRRHNLLSIGKNVMVMTCSFDDRYGIGKVTSRIGPQCDAALYTAETVFELNDTFAEADELFIDEAQFLSPAQVHQIHKNLSTKEGMRVSCFGLRSDFQGNSFPGAATLLTLADELHEISTLCRCGAKATMNQRIASDGAPIRNGDVIEIGGDSRYRPVCSKCFY
ncbi:hypothetical protein OX89_13990 [Diaphorobacter sp. J5-51]|nr:hypothetical protein OX89_13990 [Diaphorobacter sp. J5-51]